MSYTFLYKLYHTTTDLVRNWHGTRRVLAVHIITVSVS